MIWKEVGKFFKEAGEKIIGRGPEVKFRNDVEALTTRFGLTKEQAEKRIFHQYLGEVGTEIRLNGCVDSKSKDWRAFEAALKELFNSDDMSRFDRDANDPVVLRPLAMPALVRSDYSRMTSYFKGKFKGESPNYDVIKRSASDVKVMDGTGGRISHDLAPLARTPDSLGIIVVRRPEIGADIGKMLQAKRELEKIEKGLGAEMKWKEEQEKNKKEMQDLGGRFRKGVAEFFTDVFGAGATAVEASGKVDKAPGAITRLSKALLKGFGRLAVGIPHLAYLLGRKAYFYLNKELKKI